MRRLFALGLLAVMSLATQLCAQTIDVRHYEIHLQHFDFSQKSLEAETFVTFEVKEAVQSVDLELKSLVVSSVTSATTTVSGFSQEDDVLTIRFSNPLTVGDEVTLDIAYGGPTFNESWGGVHWVGEYVYNLGVGISTQPHNLGKAWFPCVDNFEDKANYDVFVTVDNDKKAVCGGLLVDVTDNADGTSTWHWSEDQMISTYHISMAVGEFEVWEDSCQGLNGEIPIAVYAKPSQFANVPGTFVHIKEIIQFFENCFGPYPFNRVGYVSTSLGCMEHVDNIALAGSILNGNLDGEDYIAHELSHMWFGNKVTCASAPDMWLNEGFAQFCGMFYTSGVYDEATFQQKMSDMTNVITTWCNNPNNWIPLNQIPLDMTYDTKGVYERGAVVVNSLMNYLGRESFLEIFRAYFERYCYETMTSEGLRDFISGHTAISMDPFFETYVFTPGMPHYDLKMYGAEEAGEGSFNVTLDLVHKHIGSDFVCHFNRVEVTFWGENGEIDTRLVDFQDEPVVVSLGFRPIDAFVDYYNHFLDGKTDGNFMLDKTGKTTLGSFQATVNSVNDSTLLRVENHLVGPDGYYESDAVTLSTKHYWKLFRYDYGGADIQATFTYNRVSDGDILTSDNDIPKLLYRTNSNDPWTDVEYTEHPSNSWKQGQFYVENFASGEYCIAACDKSLMDILDQASQRALTVYPNPADGQVTVVWNEVCDGQIVITDQQGRIVKKSDFVQADKLDICTDGFAKGVYHIECSRRNGKVLGIQTLIIN